MPRRTKDAVQEQLVTARRNQILDAATAVFAEKGFHPTTIKDIAREAGIADGTIYIYFENKTALLIAILDRMKEVALQAEDFTQLIEADLRGVIKVFLRHSLMGLKGDNFKLFRVVISEAMVNNELRELYYQKILEPTITMAELFFEQWADQQVIKPVNIGLTIRSISGLVMGLMLENIMGDKTVQDHWDDLPDFLTDLIIDGLINEGS